MINFKDLKMGVQLKYNYKIYQVSDPGYNWTVAMSVMDMDDPIFIHNSGTSSVLKYGELVAQEDRVPLKPRKEALEKIGYKLKYETPTIASEGELFIDLDSDVFNDKIDIFEHKSWSTKKDKWVVEPVVPKGVSFKDIKIGDQIRALDGVFQVYKKEASSCRAFDVSDIDKTHPITNTACISAGEHWTLLTDIKDKVPPKPREEALRKLGYKLKYDIPTIPKEGEEYVLTYSRVQEDKIRICTAPEDYTSLTNWVLEPIQDSIEDLMLKFLEEQGVVFEEPRRYGGIPNREFYWDTKEQMMLLNVKDDFTYVTGKRLVKDHQYPKVLVFPMCTKEYDPDIEEDDTYTSVKKREVYVAFENDNSLMEWDEFHAKGYCEAGFLYYEGGELVFDECGPFKVTMKDGKLTTELAIMCVLTRIEPAQ